MHILKWMCVHVYNVTYQKIEKAIYISFETIAAFLLLFNSA